MYFLKLQVIRTAACDQVELFIVLFSMFFEFIAPLNGILLSGQLNESSTWGSCDAQHAAWLRMRMTRELHAFRINGLWISDLVHGARGSATAPGIAV